MGFNISQRKVQSYILAASVTDYRDWRLIADCGACGPRSLPMRNLAASATVFEVLQRLRCRSCGGQASTVALTNDLLGWRGRAVKIWGPGSYG